MSLGISSAQSGMFPGYLFTGERLPEQVFFKKRGGAIFFFEYACAFGEEVWFLFNHLASIFGDQALWCKAVEPDPQEYYQRHFGRRAEFSLALSKEADNYINLMHAWPEDSIADAMAYRADVVAWAGSSGQWAAWGERSSNLCVLYISVSELVMANFTELANGIPLVSLEEALINFSSFEFDESEFLSFAKKMREAYSAIG